MNIIRESTPDEYLVSFWAREVRKPPGCRFPTTEADRLHEIIGRHPYKFPCDGKRETSWHICEISSVAELELLWMHKSDTWLVDQRLWRGSRWLKDLAQAARDTGFFRNTANARWSQYSHFHEWQSVGLKGRLDGHERPLLVKYPYLTDILDGFGRLLPYLALVYEGLQFERFEAYLAVPK